MRKTFRYKLYTAKHNRRLHQQINIGGVIHNHCIALHRRYYRRYKQSLAPHHLKAHIAKRKKLPQYAWWSALGLQAIQDIIERIDQGYQRFFQYLKNRHTQKTPQRVGPPAFRSVRHAKSFTLKQAGWTLLGGNRLRIGSTVYKFAQSREIEGAIKTVTIKRDALGDLSVYFSCDVAAAPVDRVMIGKKAGFDFGLAMYLTGSDGTVRQAPQPLKRGLHWLAKANQALSRKPAGSHHRRRAKAHLARLHKRVAHQRQAFHWDLAHQLCAQYDGIVLETLNLQGMKALWGRKVADLDFGTFVQILHHVACKRGTVVHHIAPWFPSTKRCSACGYLNDAITWRDRIWTCPAYGMTHQRDHNAATNIYREGASSLGGDRVRLSERAAVGDPRIPVLEDGEYVKEKTYDHHATHQG